MDSRQNESSSKAKNEEQKPSRLKAEKVFVIRESYYTTFFQSIQAKSIYLFFITVFLILLVDNVLYDFLTYGRIYLGTKTITRCCAKFHIALAVQILLHIPIYGFYFAFRTWAEVLRNLKSHHRLQFSWNYFCATIFAIFQVCILYITSIACIRNDLPFGTAVALLMEGLRITMKTYAFVRSNAPKVLADENIKDNSFQLAPLSSYSYYLFAPTFIYRDSYPRTDKIRWTFAFKHLFEIVATVFAAAFAYERCIAVNFQQFGVEQMTLAEIIRRCFSCIPASCLFLFCGHNLILHSWLNLTAELLRFGDRMYHRDWWTSTNYSFYYRAWNIVVHEWLHEYVYKDCMKHLSRVGSTLVVFYLSAIMHEYVLMIPLKMFYPVSFFMFGGSGVIFQFHPKNLSRNVGNVFFWSTLCVGYTFITCMYAIEYFARVNTLDLAKETWWEQVKLSPVSWKYFVNNNNNNITIVEGIP